MDDFKDIELGEWFQDNMVVDKAASSRVSVLFSLFSENFKLTDETIFMSKLESYLCNKEILHKFTKSKYRGRRLNFVCGIKIRDVKSAFSKEKPRHLSVAVKNEVGKESHVVEGVMCINSVEEEVNEESVVEKKEVHKSVVEGVGIHKESAKEEMHNKSVIEGEEVHKESFKEETNEDSVVEEKEMCKQSVVEGVVHKESVEEEMYEEFVEKIFIDSVVPVEYMCEESLVEEEDMSKESAVEEEDMPKESGIEEEEMHEESVFETEGLNKESVLEFNEKSYVSVIKANNISDGYVSVIKASENCFDFKNSYENDIFNEMDFCSDNDDFLDNKDEIATNFDMKEDNSFYLDQTFVCSSGCQSEKDTEEDTESFDLNNTFKCSSADCQPERINDPPPKPQIISSNSLFQYFKKQNNSFKKESTKPIYTEKYFPFRQPEKEPTEFNNLVFSRHFENYKQVTPANLPCNFDSLEEFLNAQFSIRENSLGAMNELLVSAMCGQNSLELNLKSFLCASFKPIVVGNVAPNIFNYLCCDDTFPQFTLVNHGGLVFQCEVCTVFGSYMTSKGKASSIGRGHFQGFRQVYEHSVTNHHNKAINWLKKKVQIEKASDVSQLVKKTNLSEYFQVVSNRAKKVPCVFLWNQEIVDEFKNDICIRRKQPKTIFSEKQFWKRCVKVEGHNNCYNYSHWQKIHRSEFKALCEDSSNTYRSVFVPGENSIIIEGKSVTVHGGIKSLQPLCLGTALNIGSHPFTCDNCEKQKTYLKDLMKKREQSALVTSQNRLGRKGFRLSYATKTETDERFKQLAAENKELKQQIKAFERVHYDKKAWEGMLLKSCGDNDVQKLAVDLVTLFQQPGRKGAIQCEIIKNLVGKLKSKNNHKFTHIIKDISSLYQNILGTTNYSLLQNLFGLAGKTVAKNNVETSKLHLGFNDNVFFQTAEGLYGNEPIIDATDEARLLRFISPVLNEQGEIELVGHSWNADCNEWENSKILLSSIISDEKFPDQYSALKNYVDKVFSTNVLSKDVAVHNFAAASGVLNKPLVYLIWPTPNSGYRGFHVLKVWDEVRYKCFVDANGNLREKPLKLLGHASDSAGFQLAAAVTLMTPNRESLKAGVKYLSLGIGESKFAAPYFGPLPSIAYLDYDHEMRLFLKCLKYVTVELNLFPSTKSSYIASINHLRELKMHCEKYGYDCSFSNNDLLFARFLDQNCDAALKIFKIRVAELLEENVTGSNGTILYIRAVVALFKPFLEPCSNPSAMQESVSQGITVFRIWREILKLKGKRIHSAPYASTDPSKRGFFLTYGCAQTAEILFAAATNHMLAIFAHFKELGSSLLSPFKCGTKTTERLISDIQGKTNHLQSLDAQPVLSDVITKLSKVQANHLVEDKLLAAGAKKQSTTNRRRLSHKLQEIEKNDFEFPETYLEFLESQRIAFRAGTKKGIELFRQYCPEGIEFLESGNGFGFLNHKNVVPQENQFNGSLDEHYALKMLKEIRSAEVLSASVKKKETDIRKFFEEDEDEIISDKDASVVDDNEINCSDDLKEDDASNNIGQTSKDSSKWYLTKLENGSKTTIHLAQALKALIPREHVARDRSRRHIASKYLPGKAPIDESHNILAFRFVIATVSKKIVVCKVASLFLNGVSVLSASSQNDSVTCRLIPLEEKSPFVFCFPEKVYVSQLLKGSNILDEIGMGRLDDGSLEVLYEFRNKLCAARSQLAESLDVGLAKKISKSLLPSEFEEVEDILKRKVDFKTHEFLYLVKFKGKADSEPVWLSASCFNRPFQFNTRRGLGSQEVLFANQSGNVQDGGQVDKKEASACKGYASTKKTSAFEKNTAKAKRKGGIINCEPVLKKKKSNASNQSLTRLRLFQNPKLNNIQLKEKEWLSDKHMSKAIDLLKKKFPRLNGLQDPLYGQKTFESMCGDSIQIHHDGVNHWVLSVCLNGRVYVYDSIYKHTTGNLEKQLCQCYRSLITSNSLEVHFPNVYKQAGSDDCGLFAIAYAVDIASETMPDNECYNQCKMREHFNDCLYFGEILPFPRHSLEDKCRVGTMKEWSNQSIEVSCYCMTPPTKEMIKCSLCCEMYHSKCANVNSEVGVNKDDWRCKDCIPPG